MSVDREDDDVNEDEDHAARRLFDCNGPRLSLFSQGASDLLGAWT